MLHTAVPDATAYAVLLLREAATFVRPSVRPSVDDSTACVTSTRCFRFEDHKELGAGSFYLGSSKDALARGGTPGLPLHRRYIGQPLSLIHI